ncbi:MAG TPA: hypothetical protein VFU41_11440 [Gemmatimonadales bacterium]|nr:hypothetical protein [Gemmatimonadales bacterium]
MPAKSSRHTKIDYETTPKLEKSPGQQTSEWERIGNAAELKAFLAAWMRDTKAWGENVRDDIIRLEAAVGAAPGEPGDPPPAPRT